MSAQDQDVNMNFGFALRGDRQVERGLDSIVERFARTGSFADAAALSVVKFGRVFEVGLPVALGAIFVGRAAEAIYETGQEAVRTREKINRMASEPVGELDVSALRSNLSELGDEIQEMAPEHGKKYGEAFGDAMTTGLRKTGANLDAFLNNEVNSKLPGWLSALVLPLEIAKGSTKSYDQLTGAVPLLQNRAREELSALESKDDRQTQRLERRQRETLFEENLDQSIPKNKISVLYSRQGVAEANRADTQVEKNSAQKDFDAFKSSIADGHELTQAEIQKGVMLEKRLNEARSKLLDDQISASDAQREINDYTREQLKFKKGEVVASHTRALGGGGGVFSNAPHSSAIAHLSGLGTNILSSGHGKPVIDSESMRTIDYLKRFNQGLDMAHDGLKKIALPANQDASTPVF